MKTKSAGAASARNTDGPQGKRRKTISILIIAILLLASSNLSYAWTVTATGTIRSDPNFGAANYFSPFKNGNLSLVGLPYTFTITTNPLVNGYDGSDPATHYTVGGTATPFAAAPYVMKLTVAGQEFNLIELFPASNQSSLSASQVFQQIYSNGCSATVTLCVESFILATGPAAFTTNFDFEQRLTLTGRILNPFPLSQIRFVFRNGPYTSIPTQQTSYFEGSIDDLSVRRESVK